MDTAKENTWRDAPADSFWEPVPDEKGVYRNSATGQLIRLSLTPKGRELLHKQ